MSQRDTAAQLPSHEDPRVHVRVPCYNRPDFLRRALGSLQSQTWENWVCDIYDDSTNDACHDLVQSLDDPRIHYHRNEPRRFASRNIDQCFSKDNPRDAAYFCLLEDDNSFLPDFMKSNIELLQKWGGKVVLRNQIMELNSGTDQAKLSETRLMDRAFNEGELSASAMRLSILCGIGMSHGGLFWAHDCKTDFEIHHPVNATILEPARTFVLEDDIWCALEPLAVWAQNGENTTRDLGTNYLARLGRIRATLQNERNMIALRRAAWQTGPAHLKADFLTQDSFRYASEKRARGLAGTQISIGDCPDLGRVEKTKITLRSLFVQLFFRIDPGVRAVLADYQHRRA